MPMLDPAHTIMLLPELTNHHSIDNVSDVTPMHVKIQRCVSRAKSRFDALRACICLCCLIDAMFSNLSL
jgi:hypothetical protein